MGIIFLRDDLDFVQVLQNLGNIETDTCKNKLLTLGIRLNVAEGTIMQSKYIYICVHRLQNSAWIRLLAPCYRNNKLDKTKEVHK